MKDIILNTPYKKVQNVIAWFGFIFFGLFYSWIIALVLVFYGKNTRYNTESKQGVLNKTWQKFRFVYGSIVGDLVLILFAISTILQFIMFATSSQ